MKHLAKGRGVERASDGCLCGRDQSKVYIYIFKSQIDLLIYSVSRFEYSKSQALRHKDEEEIAVFLHVLPLSGSPGALALTSPRELCKKDSQTWFPG